MNKQPRSIRLRPDTIQKITEIAKKRDRSFSYVASEVLDKFVETTTR